MIHLDVALADCFVCHLDVPDCDRRVFGYKVFCEILKVAYKVLFTLALTTRSNTKRNIIFFILLLVL